MNSAAMNTVSWISSNAQLTSLVNDKHMDNCLKEIFAFVYFASIVKNVFVRNTFLLYSAHMY